MNQAIQKSFGLEKLTEDVRDYSHDVAFGTLGAQQLPTKDFTIYDVLTYTIKWGDTVTGIAKKFECQIYELLEVNPKIVNLNKISVGQVITIPYRKPVILNQLDLDFCTAFATTTLQHAIWGQKFDPLYQMTKIKQIRGEYKQWGASLRDAMKAAIVYGSLPIDRAPYTHNGSIGDKDRDFVANWKNYPTALDVIAKKGSDLSFFTIDGTMDAFDNIRSALWIHRTERRGVSFGLFWHGEWDHVKDGIIPDVMPVTIIGGGHNIAIIGQKTIGGRIYLVLQQSWGPESGDRGFFYFPRSIINQAYAQGYGAFTLSNEDKSGMTGASNLLTVFATFINKLLGVIK